MQQKRKSSTEENNHKTSRCCHCQYHHRFAFVQECHHNQKDYYCTPPYTEKGGIRSFLLGKDIEENTEHRYSAHWPFLFHSRQDRHIHQSIQNLSSKIQSSTCYLKKYWKSQTLQPYSCTKVRPVEGGISQKQRNKHKCKKSVDRSIIQYHLSTINMTTDTSPSKGFNPSSLLSFLAFDSDIDEREPRTKPSSALGDNKSRVHKHTIETKNTSDITSSTEDTMNEATLEPATLVYHESARSIVFRDHLRRAHDAQKSTSGVQKTEHSKSDKPPSTSELNPSALKQNDQRSKEDETGSNNYHSSHASDLTSLNSTDRAKSYNGIPSQLERPLSSHHDKVTDNDATDDDFTEGSKATQDLSASFGTTNHAVHAKSVSSMVSSVEGSYGGRVDSVGDAKPQIIIANFTPKIEPLPALDLEPHNEFQDLLLSSPYKWSEGEGPEEAVQDEQVWNKMSKAEQEVVHMLLRQRCVVKTVKNTDWTAFLQKFKVAPGEPAKRWFHPAEFKDCTKTERIHKFRECTGDSTVPFNSFVTSTSLLPSYGLKMKCYGSAREYTTGIIFALPQTFPLDAGEEEAAKRNSVWAWPSGYAAKTEFNVSPYGRLINGREEALVTIEKLRSMNHSYIYDEDYEINGRMVKGGFNTLPYNEVFVRVGGLGRIANGVECGTERAMYDFHGIGRSFDEGLGLPVALFVRTLMFQDLIALLRLRARLSSIVGKEHVSGIPLLYISPDCGTRVLTMDLQQKILLIMSNSLNPFQNPHIKHKIQLGSVSERHFQQKLEELLDLDDDDVRSVLTPEECARIAGGFGATDDSVANLLMDVMLEDFEAEKSDTRTNTNFPPKGCNSQRLQRLVNEGLSASVRSNDFNTSRQLLILYTLVASRGRYDKEKEAYAGRNDLENNSSLSYKRSQRKLSKQISSISSCSRDNAQQLQRMSSSLTPPPPPPPLDTDRLRSATNSDGLLAVLGAAEVLKSIQSGAAKKRTLEAAQSIEEWIEKSENSVAYRLASWRDLTTAQDDLKINTENHSNFMAFVSNKAINNRKLFAEQLRFAVENTLFEGIEFLRAIHTMVGKMHSPCLRLELLQFILGLDNRYSVAHVARSVELAATCLNVSATEEVFSNDEEHLITENSSTS